MIQFNLGLDGMMAEVVWDENCEISLFVEISDCLKECADVVRYFIDIFQVLSIEDRLSSTK